jgi:hypothetical protein
VSYELSLNQKCSVHDVIMSGWVIRFKSILYGVLRARWYIAKRLNKVTLSDENDQVLWKWFLQRSKPLYGWWSRELF